MLSLLGCGGRVCASFGNLSSHIPSSIQFGQFCGARTQFQFVAVVDASVVCFLSACLSSAHVDKRGFPAPANKLSIARPPIFYLPFWLSVIMALSAVTFVIKAEVELTDRPTLYTLEGLL